MRNQMGDAMGEGLGLARACAGDNEKRAGAMFGRAALLDV